MNHDFIGKNRVSETKSKQDRNEGARWLGLKVLDKGPFPRTGHAVMRGDDVIGSITSGGPSPSLGKIGIGLAYLEGVEIGEEVVIAPNPRRLLRAVIVRPPFI
jgi:glycine cleavage system aminomethyltransferase T